MVRDLINLKNETHSIEDLEYGKESGKMWKMRHTHCRTGNMARNTKNMKYEKCTLQDLDFEEKTKKFEN